MAVGHVIGILAEIKSHVAATRHTKSFKKGGTVGVYVMSENEALSFGSNDGSSEGFVDGGSDVADGVGEMPRPGRGRRRQGIFWVLTVPSPNAACERLVGGELCTGLSWAKGQLERGESGYEHYQCVVAFCKKVSLAGVKKLFGETVHGELSRSQAADAYVWKDGTSLGKRFELGAKPIRVNSSVDYEAVWTAAQSGRLESIPARVRVVSYRTLRAIAADFAVPVAEPRLVWVFHGSTGTGKSRRAWEEAGSDAYPKDPRSKFWCGYRGERNVVIDEFRGGIDIAHLLRWFDR
jgi:hypothetical protein